MLESQIQAKLIKQYEKEGYYVIKILRANKNGLPDLLLIKDGRATWVEVKRPGQKPRPLQSLRLDELRKFGCNSIVVDHASQEPLGSVEAPIF